MTDLEVRELRYFIAVAEELNFSRAAERLGIAQPPLSRTVRQIESRLGVQLLWRDTRRVELTEAGRVLLAEALSIVEAVSATVNRTRRAGQITPKLTATAKPGFASGLLRGIVEAYGALPGAIQVDILVSGYRQQVQLVRNGEVDVALASSPFDLTGLDSEQLTTEPRVAALPAKHELARRPTLRCRDLAGLPFPDWPGIDAAARAYWCGQDRDFSGTRSLAPRNDVDVSGPLVSDISALLDVVGLEQAVALIPISVAKNNPRADVAYRPVVDASPFTMAMAWPAGSSDPHLAAFVRTAVEVTTALQDVDSHDQAG
ncbi:LysR family transcriptional regulator [Lentzea pudingi]|uniref:LysR family transcriptional regulator n=1 Tax=Lentzea pudingi TaxID=1789439 RepID=A0ABQ2IVR7_9PSEU|nr:LysR family transcriptional regulator [Lentzea pudingi]GGN28675.1 LysR family transcriptional regulator [Lentzea pudingi]